MIPTLTNASARRPPLESVAAFAAAYLDASDQSPGGTDVNPDYYRLCARLLTIAMTRLGGSSTLRELVRHSQSAREIADNLAMGRRLALSPRGFFPLLARTLRRAAA